MKIRLHQYTKAVEAFEGVLCVEPTPVAYHMLARSATDWVGEVE
jgi:hypothetical protein